MQKVLRAYPNGEIIYYEKGKKQEIKSKIPSDCRECFYAVRAEYGLFYCNCIGVGRVTPQPNCLENNIECVYAKLIMNKWR